MDETVLEVAIKRGYTSVVGLLLSYSAPIPPSILPFALHQSLSPQLVQLLIRSGKADVHSALFEGKTAFHLAITNYDEPTCYQLVKCLIESGRNTNIRKSMDETVLEVAVKRRYTSVVELLLLHNVQTPPHILPSALQQCLPPQLVQLLIRNGNVDVRSTSSEGETVFHLAIANYDESTCHRLVKCLIKAGANTNIRNSRGETVLDAAIQRGYASVIKLLPRMTRYLSHWKH